MERSLHRQLKQRYGPEVGGRSEVVVGDFRIDAIAPDGRLIEIQAGPLGRLRGKLGRLLPSCAVGVVKPVVVGRRIVRRDRRTGAELGARRSPKRGSVVDVFDELVALARIFPDPNLRLDVLAVEVDEVRVARRRRPGYEVVDQILTGIVRAVRLREGDDLWALLPAGLPARFTTAELAESLDRPVDFARRVAYCLLHAGAAEVVAKAGNRQVYARSFAEPIGIRTSVALGGRPGPEMVAG